MVSRKCDIVIIKQLRNTSFQYTIREGEWKMSARVLPRMTIRRWMIVIAVAALDFWAITQQYSHPWGSIAAFGTVAVLLMTPIWLLLFVLAQDDPPLSR